MRLYESLKTQRVRSLKVLEIKDSRSCVIVWGVCGPSCCVIRSAAGTVCKWVKQATQRWRLKPLMLATIAVGKAEFWMQYTWRSEKRSHDQHCVSHSSASIYGTVAKPFVIMNRHWVGNWKRIACADVQQKKKSKSIYISRETKCKTQGPSSLPFNLSHGYHKMEIYSQHHLAFVIRSLTIVPTLKKSSLLKQHFTTLNESTSSK